MTLRLYSELHAVFISKRDSSPAWAFKLVEVELGFLYDMLYTKRTLLNSLVGAILRFICFLSSCSTLVAFSLSIGFGKKTDSIVDIGISYLLLAGAVALDIYSIIAHGLSDWPMLHKRWLNTFVYRAITSRLDSRHGVGELRFMAQYNLIRFCLRYKTSKIAAIKRCLDIDKYFHITWEKFNVDMKVMIYSYILKKQMQYKRADYQYGFLTELLSKRGNGMLEEKGILDEFTRSIGEVEFNKSLLLWHIATDLSYYADGSKYSTDILGSHYKMSKALSDYMLYLLVMRPSMFPEGINEILFRDTCEEVKRFLEKTEEFDMNTAITAILVDSEDRPNFHLPGKSKSVFFNGISLAKQLQNLVTDNRWDLEEKWEIICQVWMEMLTYVASNCGWKEHAQHLKDSKELLTHVCLLMANLGLSAKIHLVPLPIELQFMTLSPPGIGIPSTWHTTWFEI